LEVIAHQRPSNIPGKSLIVLRLFKPPNAATPPHKHAGAAALGLTIHGQVLNQMNTSKPVISKSGECWYEAPGCHHVRGENASKDESASFFAVLVVDDDVVKDGYEGLVVIDEEVKTAAKEAASYE
jgi:quercetin dioxygenase-like cupin family protein